MKSQVKAGLKALNLYRPASQAWIALEPRLIRLVRSVTGENQRLIDRYLAANPVAKLQIGCGDNELAGWLNTELCPRGEQIFLDAMEPFPFADNVFAFVYSEHMIEHIPLHGAHAMLSECHRVTRPGGTIRIVTPDMAFLATLLAPDPSPTLSAYIDYYIREHLIDAPGRDGHAVFNHFMKAWGHQHIHGEASLRGALERAGWTAIRRVKLNESEHPELSGLAKTDRMPPGFLEMESFALESRKPSHG